MKRRSKVSGGQVKGRRRKTPEPKRRNAPKAPAAFNASSAVEETKVARLTHELREALEQQSATSEVLRVISSYPRRSAAGIPRHAENAVRLCDAEFGNIYHWDGEALHLVATQNAPPAFAEARRLTTGRPGSKTPTGRMIANKKVVHIADLRAEKAYADRDPWIVAGVEIGGVRTVLMVPMLKESELIGAFSVYRQEVRPFTERQIALGQELRGASRHCHRKCAVTRRTAAAYRRPQPSARLTSQRRWSIKPRPRRCSLVISSFPGDLQPVFDTMLANATRLCEATHGHVWTFDGEQLHAVAVRGDAQFVKWLRDHNPVRPIPGSAGKNALSEAKRFVHVADRRQEPAYHNNQTFRGLVDTSGIRASLSVALRKGETLLGVINVYPPRNPSIH